jgi:hypothetical protein
MSDVFRTREWLSIPQLVPAWALELAKDKERVGHEEEALLHTLSEDIITGRLDNSGPLRNDGRRLGLRFELGGRGYFVEGHELRVFICRPTQTMTAGAGTGFS